MEKKLIIVLVLVVVAGALLLSGWKPGNSLGRTAVQSQVEIQEYSISATIVAIEGGNYLVRASKLMTGPEGNYIGTEEKRFSVGEATVVRKLTNRNGDILIADAVASDIKEGQNVTLYASVDMASKDSFTPSRVDIQL